MTKKFVLTLRGQGNVLRDVVAWLTVMGRVGCQQTHHDQDSAEVFARVEFDSERSLSSLRTALGLVKKAYSCTAEIHSLDVIPRLVVLVSREEHCLADLLYHQGSPALPAEIATVISNQDHLQAFAETHGIPFVHIPWENPDLAAQQLFDQLKTVDPDFIVLARFMRILPRQIVDAYQDRVINVHHAPLPGFAGLCRALPGLGRPSAARTAASDTGGPPHISRWKSWTTAPTLISGFGQWTCPHRPRTS